MGSKVLSLGQGPFRQSMARTNPKLMIAPGWESGECLMNIQAFEEPSRNTTEFLQSPTSAPAQWVAISVASSRQAQVLLLP